MSNDKEPRLFIGGREIIPLPQGEPCKRCQDRNWANNYGGEFCPLCEGINAMEADRRRKLQAIAHELLQVFSKARAQGMRIETRWPSPGEENVVFTFPPEPQFGVLTMAIEVGVPT